MSPRIRAARWFAHIFDLIAAEIGYTLALLDPFVQAARRVYQSACRHG